MNKIIENIEKDILSLDSSLLYELEAVLLIGSILRDDFNERSDIDVVLIFKEDIDLTIKKEILWWNKIKEVLMKYHRDITVICYKIIDLINIINWYIFELASDSIIIFDRGKVKPILNKILEKTKEWDLVRVKFSKQYCWMIEHPKPAEVVEFKLTEADVKSLKV